MEGKQRPTDEGGVLTGVLAIVLTGLALGLAFNVAGNASEGFGLDWIGQDPLETVPTLDGLSDGDPAPTASSGSSGPATYGEMDDPMGIPAHAGGAGLPQIPDLDRPIQVGIDAVRQFIDAEAALLVDAREPDEFAEGHLPGAINMPYDEVSSDPARIEQLSSGGRPIIIYCGGGKCELSLSLGFDMIYAGHKKVLVYMGGYPEWVDAGYPVESGPEQG